MGRKTKGSWVNKITVSNKSWGPISFGSKRVLSGFSFCTQRLTALRDSVVIELSDRAGLLTR